MKKIEQAVKKCKKCGLWKIRKNPVPGEGSVRAKVMFIGEAPGFNEDLEGRPFVGRAGKVLDELLDSAGLKRDRVYIGNVIKCRPPGNRNPTKEEIKACTPYLDRQIGIIKPKTICPMGNFAAAYIFEKFGLRSESIGKIHGRVFRVSNLLGKMKIIPLYHPASAVYNPNMKGILMRDFRSIK